MIKHLNNKSTPKIKTLNKTILNLNGVKVMSITVTTDELIDINEMAQALLDYEYYDYVAFGFIEEAVAQAYQDTGMALTSENLEKYHEYISENLI